MEDSHMLSERPPSYAQSHDPQAIHLPAVPTTELSSINHERTLPPLPSILSEPSYRQTDPMEHKYASAWPSSNPLSVYYQPTSTLTSPTSRSTKGIDSPSAMDIDTATPDSRGRRGGSVLSIDDPDVRIAAEALGDLRAADFITSPPQRHTALPPSSPLIFQQAQQNPPQPEPLLSLLTTSHPLLGTAIGGSLSAYSASKNYSPRFKSSAEYVERRFTPVVNTVGSVGRVTGVEGGVRWFLGGRTSIQRQTSDLESGDQGSHKRRKVFEDSDMTTPASRDPHLVHRQDFHLQHRERAPSQGSTVESLPAYDDHRSPNYEAQALIPTQESSDSPTSLGSTWQSRLILSTSGLSVAMSEESLRSLKYCLGWLRWANEHIDKVINALKEVLEQYNNIPSEAAGSLTTSDLSGNVNDQDAGALIIRSEADKSKLNARIAELKSDVLKTLKDVVDVVSKYAGGALPENARVLVRRHLTSLPQRFKLASKSTGENVEQGSASGDGEVKEAARRVMVLAREGLDMMSQVSGVLDGTIVSAEEWCERLGRKNRGDAETSPETRKGLFEPAFFGPMTPQPGDQTRPFEEDVKMG